MESLRNPIIGYLILTIQATVESLIILRVSISYKGTSIAAEYTVMKFIREIAFFLIS